MEKIETSRAVGTITGTEFLSANASQNLAKLIAISPQGQFFESDTITTHGMPRFWEPAGEPLINNFAADVSVDQENGNIFVATESNGILLSTDIGQSWTEKNSGLDLSLGYYNIDINPFNRDLYTSNPTGVYYSSDYANSWEPRAAGLGNNFVSDFAFTSSGNILAGTYGSGVFLYDTVNAVWNPRNSGLPATDYLVVHTITTDRQTGSLFASTNGDGVYRSIDDGGSWNEVLNPRDNFYVDFLYVDFLKADNGFVVAAGNTGAFSSTDDGATWDSWENFPGNYSRISSVNLYEYRDTINIICGVEGLGVTASYDRGSTWSWQNNGLTAYTSYNLSFKPKILYTDNGIYHEDFENGLNPWQNSWLGGDYPPLTTSGMSNVDFWHKQQFYQEQRLPIPDSLAFFAPPIH